MDKKMTKESLKNAAAELGRRGGKAFVKKYGKDAMKKLSKKAVKARQLKK